MAAPIPPVWAFLRTLGHQYPIGLNRSGDVVVGRARADVEVCLSGRAKKLPVVERARVEGWIGRLSPAHCSEAGAGHGRNAEVEKNGAAPIAGGTPFIVKSG